MSVPVVLPRCFLSLVPFLTLCWTIAALCWAVVGRCWAVVGPTTGRAAAGA